MGQTARGLAVPGPRWVCSPSWERNFLPLRQERGGCPASLGSFPGVEEWPKSDLCPSGFLGDGAPSLAEPPALSVAGREAPPSFSALSPPQRLNSGQVGMLWGSLSRWRGWGAAHASHCLGEDALMGEECLPTASSHSFFSFSCVTLISRGQRASRVHRGSQDPKACRESKETR